MSAQVDSARFDRAGLDEAARAEFARRLDTAMVGEVDFSPTARAVFSADASVYRQVPLGVAYPASADDVAAAVELCRGYGVALTSRGAGTSIAGQVLGRGLVLDFSRHLNRILSLDAAQGTAWVQPGLVLDELRAAAEPHGLTFGPDPSTHSRCTLGGMIGNDSCGSHSVAWGRTADNVVELDVLLDDGTRLTLGRTSPEELADKCALGGRAGELYRGLRALAQDNLALLRTGLPALGRRVSGYALDALLPENGFDAARALVGTEGTCAVVLAAKVRLVQRPAARALVVAGYPDTSAAADAVPAILEYAPLTVEGMGADMIATLRARTPEGGVPAAVDTLPEGGGWLFIEVGGSDGEEARRRAEALAQAAADGEEAALDTAVLTDPAEQRALWSIREAGSGLVTRSPDGSEAWPGWEDSAVPPQALGRYLKELRALLESYGYSGVPYGHFGEGCVHIRIDFDLDSDTGRAWFRAFMVEAADLVVSYGGSVSGEHGDGQARGELLERMYAPQMLGLFARFKALFDPGDVFNPGIGVAPRRMDADLRVTGPSRELPVALPFAHDGGSLATASRRCVGVGKCVDTSSGTMCPSYMVTRQEQHSTRGRARLLGEMLRGGGAVTDGWASEEVRDALDLCLSCKACSSECPVGVDMATYKSEFLYQHYRHRLRPVTHYSLGALPLWLALSAPAAPAANAVAATRWGSAALKRAAGIAPERELPVFARTSFTRRFNARRRARANGGAAAGAAKPPVLLWPDSFTNYLEPGVGVAATEVLEHAGFEVHLPRGPVCCGLTWVTTGQIDTARAVMRRTVAALRAPVLAGAPIVGLEPSCTAVLRGELGEWLGEDTRGDTAEVARRVGEQTYTLAEFLTSRAPDTEFGDLGADALTQVHCHQSAALGFKADERVMGRAGITNRTLDSGCCGLAGNFGFEDGHYEVSVGAAERVLMPEVRAAGPETAILADGFSCRTQIAQLSDRRAEHLAQVLHRAIKGG